MEIPEIRKKNKNRIYKECSWSTPAYLIGKRGFFESESESAACQSPNSCFLTWGKVKTAASSQLLYQKSQIQWSLLVKGRFSLLTHQEGQYTSQGTFSVLGCGWKKKRMECRVDPEEWVWSPVLRSQAVGGKAWTTCWTQNLGQVGNYRYTLKDLVYPLNRNSSWESSVHASRFKGDWWVMASVSASLSSVSNVERGQ